MIEALTNSVLGLGISWAITYLALPFWGYEPGVAEASGITLMYFAASFLRGWIVRGAFRRWG